MCKKVYESVLPSMEYNSPVLSLLEEEMAGRANAILVIAQSKDRAKAASLVERTYPRWGVT